MSITAIAFTGVLAACDGPDVPTAPPALTDAPAVATGLEGFAEAARAAAE
ncbi:MAG: hypothetical protein AAGA63_08690 [Pseudomonadota bacterium]